MAKIVFTNGVFVLNGVDLSDHVNEGTLDVSIADVDLTAMGAGGVQRLPGLQDNKLDVTFWNDYASSSVDKTIWAIIQGGTAVAFYVIPNGTAVSDSNPKYSGTLICTGYQPVGGKVGDGLSTKPSFAVSGTVSRGTT